MDVRVLEVIIVIVVVFFVFLVVVCVFFVGGDSEVGGVVGVELVYFVYEEM